MNTPIRAMGLESYLNLTRAQHNSFGWMDFKRLLNAKVNKTNMARAFLVSKHTMDKWLTIYYEEGNHK